MVRKILQFALVYIAALQLCFSVGADVITTGNPQKNNNAVFVAGNMDLYPIEYYNDSTGDFEGVFPEIYKEISGRTGLDIVYVYDEKMPQYQAAVQYSCDLVSAFITDSETFLAEDSVTVFSYNVDGKIVNLGVAFTENCDPDTAIVLKNELMKVTAEDINGHLVMSLRQKDNHRFFDVTLILLCVIFCVILVATIEINRRMTKKRMHHERMFDAETGIGNLVYFEHRFNNIPDNLRSTYYAAYIILDSNYMQLHYGEVNFTDTLKYTATTLLACTEDNGFAARITDNGFAVAFSSQDLKQAEDFITDVFEKLCLFVVSDDNKQEPFFRMAVYNLNASDRSCEFTLFNLRKNCNKLMGKDRYIAFCDEKMMNRAVEERILLEKIENGLNNREFKLYLQFVVDSKSGNIVSSEALSRWESPESGILSPGHYIEAMESTGLITDFDYYMLEKVCMQLHKWKDTEFEDISISCNFTRITLSDPGFIDKVKEIINKYVFSPSKLIVEITEDAIERNRDIVTNNLLECKKLGFGIALDDMGSGYTSLINMCEYPIDIVKIDRDILLNTDKQRGKDLFFGIVALSHSLNLKVVCEGVETSEQNDFVTKSNCDFIQGWFYSKAVSESESEQFIKDYTPPVRIQN